MYLVIALPWNRQLGFSNDDPLEYLEKKHLVIDYYPNNNLSIKEFLENFRDIYKTSQNSVKIYFANNIYEYKLRTFANINHNLMNRLHKISEKQRKKTFNLNKKSSIRFKQLRGRYPGENEI